MRLRPSTTCTSRFTRSAVSTRCSVLSSSCCCAVSLTTAGSRMAQAVAIIAIFATLAYALLGGADFGGGVWDLFALGERKSEQRAAIAHAMGPVWEANHVWLIFLIVILFTAFPPVYS